MDIETFIGLTEPFLQTFGPEWTEIRLSDIEKANWNWEYFRSIINMSEVKVNKLDTPIRDNCYTRGSGDTFTGSQIVANAAGTRFRTNYN